jgi:beta-glucosidase
MSDDTVTAPDDHDGQLYTFDDAVQDITNRKPIDDAVSILLSHMSQKEQLSLLDGDEPFWKGLGSILCDRYNRVPFVMGAVPRLKIPGIKFTDGPRGIVMGASTCFPVSMSRGATWDTELEKKIGHAIGLEGRAQGANYFAGICINLPRHPAWGRIQETYSEDPILLGEFGLALNDGVKPHLMTCVKHYALNSMEIARFRVDVKVDDAALHEVYLPHFRRLVEGGVTSVMSSYNSVRGEFAGHNHELLTRILREQWRFDGFVLSDFIFGLRDAALSVKNGLDIEAPFAQQRDMHLQKAIDAGDLGWSHVSTACTRILRKQLQHVATTGYEIPEESVVFCDAHRQLAREAAAKGIVLLKNEHVGSKPLLPLNGSQIRKIAIVGRLANTNNTGDRGSSAVFAPKVVTAYEGRSNCQTPTLWMKLDRSLAQSIWSSVSLATTLATRASMSYRHLKRIRCSLICSHQRRAKTTAKLKHYSGKVLPPVCLPRRRVSRSATEETASRFAFAQRTSR